MDDLEFRRRLFADPNDDDPKLQASKNASVTNRKLANDLINLDAQLKQAMDVDVPDDLAEKILFKQAGQPSVKSDRRRWYPALAASIALVVGIFIGRYDITPIAPAQAENLAQIAIKHVDNEAPFIRHVDEGVALQQVNAKLSPFGNTFKALPGHIYYVNHCGFGKMHALHMVMQTEVGKVTVFIVPETSAELETYSNSQVETVVMPIHEASLVIVGDTGQNLMPVADSIRADLQQSI